MGSTASASFFFMLVAESTVFGVTSSCLTLGAGMPAGATVRWLASLRRRRSGRAAAYRTPAALAFTPGQSRTPEFGTTATVGFEAVISWRRMSLMSRWLMLPLRSWPATLRRQPAVETSMTAVVKDSRRSLSSTGRHLGQRALGHHRLRATNYCLVRDEAVPSRC